MAASSKSLPIRGISQRTPNRLVHDFSSSLRLFTLVLCLPLLGGAFPAVAASDVFLELSGIPGESVAQGHANEIELLSWNWGLNQRTGESNRVRLSDLSVTKYVDRATPALMRHCSSGQIITNGLLTARRVLGGGKGLEFVKVGITNAKVTALSEGGNVGEDVFVERVGLSYTQVRFDYFYLEGTAMRNAYFTWDIGRNAGAGGPAGAVDTDNDGMPDLFEETHGLDRFTADGESDKDRDGMSNLDEYRAGTSPSDANSIFQCRLIHIAGQTTATLSWNSLPGREYRVAYTANPGSPMSLLGNYSAATGTVTQITIPTDLARRFYSIQVRQLP